MLKYTLSKSKWNQRKKINEMLSFSSKKIDFIYFQETIILHNTLKLKNNQTPNFHIKISS